jgi:hypothetical protein
MNIDTALKIINDEDLKYIATECENVGNDQVLGIDVTWVSTSLLRQ